MDKIYEVLKKAINEKKEVVINSKYGLDGTSLDVRFHPYILGNDLMQYSFVWGFLPHNNLPYKFLLNNINKVTVSSNTFKLETKLCYHYSLEEEHFECVDSFDNVYID